MLLCCQKHILSHLFVFLTPNSKVIFLWKSRKLDAFRQTHLLWNPLNNPQCVWLFRKDCQLMEEWMLDVKAKNQPTSISIWVVSHLPATSHAPLWNVTNGSWELPWLTFVNSVIHTLQRRCRCRWMELRWVGLMGKLVTIIFHVWLRMKEISHVTEWKTAECRPELHEWNGNAFTWWCFVFAFLPSLVQLLCALQATVSVFGPFITASCFLFCSCYIDSYCLCVYVCVWDSACVGGL